MSEEKNEELQGEEKILEEGKSALASLFHSDKFKKLMEKVERSYTGEAIKFPLEVNSVKISGNLGTKRHENCGKMVAIRPCAVEHEGKTFLGVYLGDFPISISESFDPIDKELSMVIMRNPAIFIPDLNDIIYGCQSWWSIIEKESDLKQITDQDIQNVWYVKALKVLTDNGG